MTVFAIKTPALWPKNVFIHYEKSKTENNQCRKHNRKTKNAFLWTVDISSKDLWLKKKKFRKKLVKPIKLLEFTVARWWAKARSTKRREAARTGLLRQVQKNFSAALSRPSISACHEIFPTGGHIEDKSLNRIRTGKNTVNCISAPLEIN